MSGRRELTAALAGLAVGGGLALSAGGQTWATATVGRRAPLPPVTETLGGSDLAPLVPACGLLLLAAAAAVVAVRGQARRLVGLLAAAGGGALIWSGLRALLTDPGLADLSAGSAVGATVLEVSRSGAWPLLTVAAGVLGVAGGVLTALRGPAWSGMGRRYERTTGAAPAAARTREDRVLDAWRALDRGEDPTSGDADESAPGGDRDPPPAGGDRTRL